ncbi:MAG: hypothetical protein QOI92_2335, partial [Chloroflexota bacterium]|nr:hypothetical protein [Chloroflexota bacterium]
HTLATQPHLVGRYRTRLEPTTEPASVDASQGGAQSASTLDQDTMAVRLTGASMRLLEVGLAVAAVATALLAGVGR